MAPALVLAGALLAVPAQGQGSEVPDRPNVIFYVVDTLRADHLGVYGYQRSTSPNLDAWSEQAVVFDEAYSTASWTRPAMVSLFSGRDAASHRVEDRLDTIPDDLPLLAERMKEQGYSTYAAVTNPNVLPHWGFGRGFDVYEDLGSEGHAATADRVTAFIEGRMEELAAQQPFLLYVHLIDPHAPFDPPHPYNRKFPRSPAFPPEQSIGHYDGEIAFVDHEFGRFTELLDKQGLTDNSMVIFTSDHGEELLDHGGFGHGSTLYQEVVRIPLIMRLPNSRFGGSRVVSPISLIDIAPTVSSTTGVPMSAVDGRNLMELLPAGPADLWADRSLFFSIYTTGPASHSVQGTLSGDFKYIRRTRPEETEQVFDIRRDPREKSDLVRRQPGERTRLATLLDAHVAETTRGIQVRIVSDAAVEHDHCAFAMRTNGRFTNVQGLRLEDGDTIAASDDARELRVECSLVNRRQTLIAGERLVPDEDGVIFQVDPIDATVWIEESTTNDGDPLPLRVGRHGLSADVPFSFTASDQPMGMTDPRQMLQLAHTDDHPGPGAYVGVVRLPEAAGEVAPEILERLRGLGYIQGDGG